MQPFRRLALLFEHLWNIVVDAIVIGPATYRPVARSSVPL